MSVVTLILILLAIGLGAWAVGFLPFIDATFKTLIRGVLIFVAVVLIVVWVAGLLGADVGSRIQL